mmetsp:Transcript_94176/g.288109  ORF Transcript_94176/g.288109 Transcript_94176/m.288109 type:complete len:202 (+) Transcript_94176:1816-2421(+)
MKVVVRQILAQLLLLVWGQLAVFVRLEPAAHPVASLAQRRPVERVVEGLEAAIAPAQRANHGAVVAAVVRRAVVGGCLPGLLDADRALDLAVRQNAVPLAPRILRLVPLLDLPIHVVVVEEHVHELSPLWRHQDVPHLLHVVGGHENVVQSVSYSRLQHEHVGDVLMQADRSDVKAEIRHRQWQCQAPRCPHHTFSQEFPR